jgi:membrane protein implicated in regulation of membrane protease activity
LRPGAIAASPLFNVSSLLAFLTWFGAAGYVLLRFAVWPLPAAFGGAVAAGAAGAVLIAVFLQRVLAGEQEMNPRDYRLEGTIARVTASIPAEGVGEIVFTKAGKRRSEGARSRTGQPIAHGTEVVIIEYVHGIAFVQSWDDLMAERGTSGRPELGT